MAASGMTIDQIILREIRLPMIDYFETSFGRTQDRHVLLVEIACQGQTGWGECVAGEGPFYSSETADTAWSILTRFILPTTVKRSFDHPSEFPSWFERIRGHRMAKACVEAALWDLQAQRMNLPLWRLLGGTREKIPCGVSIGIQEDPQTLLKKIKRELEAGYRKVKMKIKPGWDVQIVALVREQLPDIPLMVDANSAYTLEDTERLRELDQFKLLMIEQPLIYDDLADHARLQAQIETPICLDESIRHSRDADHACQLSACQIINVKMGRVGGHTEAKRVHDVAQQYGVPVWCGGMLETGIGRAHNIALSTLENFTLPGDVSASRRYYERDTIRPEVVVTSDGYIQAPQSSGLGYEADRDWIEQLTVRTERFQ